jgi:hypothetical protein
MSTATAFRTRRDVVYNPVWDRDGDGIPNRYDRQKPRPGDRDGDGMRNRHDRHPERARPRLGPLTRAAAPAHRRRGDQFAAKQ